MAIGVTEVNRQCLTLRASANAGATHVGLVPRAVAEGNARILDGLEARSK